MMLMNNASIEDARDYCLVGCVEPYIPGKMSKWTDGGHYNYGSAMEMALTNGVSIMNDGRCLGIRTGDPAGMSFDEFKHAVKTQLAYYIKQIATACHICERLHAEYTPYPYMSSMIDGCIESGTDITQGGAELTIGPAFIGTGIADLANSLSVIKQFVYDDKKIKMSDLVKAIRANFKGYEDMRAMLENKGRHYGNDDDYVDEFVREMTDFAFREIRKYRSYRGPEYISGLYPVASHVPHGEVVSALPYGRLQGLPLADGCSPKGGTDVKGPTAVLKSVSKINHDSHVAGTLLNMRLDPLTSLGDAGRERIVSLIRTFVDLNIYHVQFNIISSDLLRTAQLHPKEHRSLIVRVAGYSAFFTELCEEMQDDIIQRTIQKF
jgi:formate C-acetyltransferase